MRHWPFLRSRVVPLLVLSYHEKTFVLDNTYTKIEMIIVKMSWLLVLEVQFIFSSNEKIDQGPVTVDLELLVTWHKRGPQFNCHPTCMYRFVDCLELVYLQEVNDH